MEKLKELFQLDQPDLDFGFYRIMHMKAEEISQFLDQDLLQIIEDEFKESSMAKSKTEAQQARETLIAALGEEALNEDGTVKEALASLPAAQAYTEAMAKAGAHVASLSDEGQIYDHLYRFFERYYEGGDFLSRRYYTRETAGQAAPYAIPYNGEEVKLHWANSDQYYIKTAEHFSNYSFDLITGSEVNAEDKRKKGITEEADLFSAQGGLPDKLAVHFQIVEAAEGKHGNIKASDDDKRFFFLHKSAPIAFNAEDELMINFEYRPAASEDALDADRKAELKKYHIKKDGTPYGGNIAEGELPPLDIADSVLEALSESESAHAATYLSLLKQTAPTEKINHRPLLAKYIKQYTGLNSMDYFIHKDLGTFLKRELDFYIKNEIMRLDDLTSDAVEAPAVEDYLAKVKVLRKIAQKLITFLAQLEEFQKKLWLKKKFVTETNYCITLDRIPEEFYPEIVEAAEVQVLCPDGEMRNQREEWNKLFAINEIRGEEFGEVAYTHPLTVEFLKGNDKLLLDTAFLSDALKGQILGSIEDFDEACNGLLIHSENFQALQLLQRKYKSQIQCTYIDPPYNTGDSKILYKNSYDSSAWLSLMENRMALSLKLLDEDAVYFVAIDDYEMVPLCNMIDTHLPLDREMIVVNHHPQGGKANTLANTHEYMLAMVSKGSDRTLIGRTTSQETEERPYKRSGTAQSNFRQYRPNSFFAFLVDKETHEIVGLEEPPSRDSSYPTQDTREGFKRVYPIGKNNSERVWRNAYETAKEMVPLKKFKCSESFTIYQLIEHGDKKTALFSNWIDRKYNAGTYGANLLNNIIGPENPFSYPKSLYTVQDALFTYQSDEETTVLDFFGGSGTTAHAVIDLNRSESGLNKKYVMVEMGEHFEAVTKPRVLKVCYSPDWKDGKPTTRDTGISHCFKYIRLESYEDCLNNLAFNSEVAPPDDSFKEPYYLNYLLDHQTKGSPSLLNIEQFSDPTAYKMKVKKPGSDASVEQAVDLIETFNYLIGLRVETLSAPQYFCANFIRPEDPDVPEGQQTKLQLDGRLKQDADGPFWFRAITGWVPKNASIPDKETREEKPQNKERVLIIWRKLTGDIEQDNAVLDEYFRKHYGSTQDKANAEFDTIYVNGSNNLPNLKLQTDRWRVVLLEEAFHKLMWDTQDV